MEWSNEETMLFLEVYHSEPVLWDPAHEKHKDKKFLIDAWNRIRDSEPFNHRTLPELKKKKESLMASFRTHLRKKKASIRSGAGAEDVYKPVWFAYEYMENFLAQIYEVHKSINTQNQEDPLPDVQDTLPESLEDRDAFVNVEHSTEIPDLQPIPLTPARQTQRKPAAATAGSSAQSTNRRRANPPELIEAEKQMQQAFGMLQDVTSRKPVEQDECDLYGKMIAKKLRKLPENERDMVMYELDGFLLERTRKIHRSASLIEHPENSLNIGDDLLSVDTRQVTRNFSVHTFNSGSRSGSSLLPSPSSSSSMGNSYSDYEQSNNGSTFFKL